MPINFNKQRKSRFQISLALILISFLFLFVFSYNALKDQIEQQKAFNLKSKLSEIDKFSQNYFSNLQKTSPKEGSIRVPIEKTLLPALKIPSSSESKIRLFRSLLSTASAEVALTEGILNSETGEREFWQFLKAKLFFQNKNYFGTRSLAFELLASPFDYQMPNGNTLKFEATILAAKVCYFEKNINALKQWLFKLRELPLPNSLPTKDFTFLSKFSPEIETWIKTLTWCYQQSFSGKFNAGWINYENVKLLVYKHKTGMLVTNAIPHINIINKQIEKMLPNNISYTITLKPNGNSNQQLSGSNGLYVELKDTSSFSVQTGFFWLIILTSIGIIGLFKFSLSEWQINQQKDLLDREELFFKQTAHDLKTPMATISFLAETLSLKRFKSEEQKEKYLNQLLSETNRSSKMIDQMLLSVRLRKKSILPDLQTIPVQKEINKLLTRFTPRLSTWKVKIDYQTDKAILADFEMWERVMINLIENSLKHAESGKELAIQVTQNSPNKLLIKIGDRGQGFKKAESNSPESFFKTSLPYRANRGGSGIGLLLVKQIMSAHEGDFAWQPRKEAGIWMITEWKTS